MLYIISDIFGIMLALWYISLPIMIIFYFVQKRCIKKDSIIIKLIPIYIIIVATIIGFYEYTGSGFSTLILADFLLGVIAIPGLVGVLAAWVVYKVRSRSD